MKVCSINQGVCWNESISIENKSRLRKNLLFIDGVVYCMEASVQHVLEYLNLA